MVVDTVGFNEAFWINRGQVPHTSQLHLIEKYTRTSLDTMRYELPDRALVYELTKIH